MSKEVSPEELEELKRSIQEKIEVIKENAEDEKTLEKMEKFSAYLEDDSRHSDRHKARHYEKLDKRLSFFQQFKLGLERDLDIDPGRLVGLTDGIFGMVMTLLVFGIALPELQITNNSNFVGFISTLAPTIGVTIVSFVLIASFWIYHHEFIKVKSLNIPYLWINIMFLICISFIPFSTSLIGHYSQFFLSEVFFGADILLVNFFFILMYHYADKKHFLENKPSKQEKRHVLHTMLLIMGLTVVVNLLDFNVSSNFIYLFLLVPVISTIRDINYKMKI